MKTLIIATVVLGICGTILSEVADRTAAIDVIRGGTTVDKILASM